MTLPQLLLEASLGLLIGVLLGTLGGGGSILTVPALVYLVGQPAGAAVTASLIIVGANSTAGALTHRAQGTLNWRIALIFGGAGMLFSYVAAALSQGLSKEVLLVAFALLMLVVGGVMLLYRAKDCPDCAAKGPRWWKVIGGGIGVGILTGFLGVGGGFLIVPALVMLVGLPMQQAIGTSLVVIAMNSAAGLLGHLGGVELDWLTILIFGGMGILGAAFGARIAARLNPHRLRQGFAVFVLLLGALLLIDNLRRLSA
ncbi:MAG: hypothetical protein OHK0023_00640 [Anaerolineae bacterium]